MLTLLFAQKPAVRSEACCSPRSLLFAQKPAVRSEAMFNQLKWMTFPERVVYHKAVQMYKTAYGDAPD